MPTKKEREAVAAAKAQVTAAFSAIKMPDKRERMKELAIEQLPYHHQYLNKGTVYSAVLVSPVPFGTAAVPALAPAGTAPAPSSVLSARLTTTLDSSKTPRGTEGG